MAEKGWKVFACDKSTLIYLLRQLKSFIASHLFADNSSSFCYSDTVHYSLASQALANCWISSGKFKSCQCHVLSKWDVMVPEWKIRDTRSTGMRWRCLGYLTCLHSRPFAKVKTFKVVIRNRKRESCTWVRKTAKLINICGSQKSDCHSLLDANISRTTSWIKDPQVLRIRQQTMYPQNLPRDHQH